MLNDVEATYIRLLIGTSFAALTRNYVNLFRTKSAFAETLRNDMEFEY